MFIKYNWEAVIGLLLCLLHIFANLEAKTNPETDCSKNKFAADLVSRASAAGITAVSLLLSATFVIVQISSQPGKEFLPLIKTDIFHGAISFLLSMMLGLFLMWVVPTIQPSKNVNQQFIAILPYGFQLITLLTGVLYLVSAFYRLMFH
jgi:hypothetical protein